MQNIHKKLQNLSILIVEDDISTLKWLSRILAIYFKEVYTAEDAMQALEIFNNKSFDVVISDIEMPHVDGLHLLQKIALIKNSTIRAVMTAFNSQEYMNRVIESDVHFYFKKPIDIDELLVAVSSKLTKQNLKDIVSEVEATNNPSTFKDAYTKLTSALSNHLTILGAFGSSGILTELTKYLG